MAMGVMDNTDSNTDVNCGQATARNGAETPCYGR